MVALCFMNYNLGRVLQALFVTPALEAGIADRVWSIECWSSEEIVALQK